MENIAKIKKEVAIFTVCYQYGSSTGNVWTDWYHYEFNSLEEAVKFKNKIIEDFNKDNESYCWNRRINIFIKE